MPSMNAPLIKTYLNGSNNVEVPAIALKSDNRSRCMSGLEPQIFCIRIIKLTKVEIIFNRKAKPNVINAHKKCPCLQYSKPVRKSVTISAVGRKKPKRKKKKTQNEIRTLKNENARIQYLETSLVDGWKNVLIYKWHPNIKNIVTQ